MTPDRRDATTLRAKCRASHCDDSRRPVWWVEAVSHEWYCRCPRCAADALLDTLDDDEAEAQDAERDELTYGPRVNHAAD